MVLSSHVGYVITNAFDIAIIKKSPGVWVSGVLASNTLPRFVVRGIP